MTDRRLRKINRRELMKPGLFAGCAGLLACSRIGSGEVRAGAKAEITRAEYLCPPDVTLPFTSRPSRLARPIAARMFVPLLKTPTPSLDPPPVLQAHQLR